MASFTESIKLVVDVVASNAKSELGNLKSKINDAEGGFNKFKAAGGGAMDFLRSNALLAVGGVAAVGGAAAEMATKSVRAFQDTALKAGEFSDATGLSVDAASRLVEVSGDIGVSSDAVQTALGKMSKQLGTNQAAFKAYGVEVAHAKDGTVDIQQTFLNAVDALHKIPDPAERAAAAAKIFGKGWQSMAELIGMSSADIQTAMKGVSSAQAISDDELKKAREFRELLDTIHDAAQAVALTVGGALVENILEFGHGLSEAAKSTEPFRKFFESMFVPAEKLIGLLDQTSQSADKTNQMAFGLGQTFHLTEEQIRSAADGVDLVSGALQGSTSSVEDAMAAQEAANTVTEKLGEEARVAASKVAGLGRQFETSTDVINGALGRLDIADETAHMNAQLQTLHDKAVEAWNASASGAANAKQKQEEFAQATRDTQRELLTLLGRINNLPTSKTTEIVAMIDRGSFDEAARRIAILARNQTMTLSIVTRGGAGFNTTGTPHFQEGGTVPGPKGKPQLAVVHGGEQVIPIDSGTALPLGLPAAAATSTTNVYMNGTFIGPDKTALGAWFQDAIAAAQRRGFRAS
jgi:hypothetical protein